MSERIERIKNAVEKREGCRAKHIESLRVQEKWFDEIAWDGVVETFAFTKSSDYQARLRMGTTKPGEEPRYTIVPSVPPVNSARDAVQAAILAVVKNSSGSRSSTRLGHCPKLALGSRIRDFTAANIRRLFALRAAHQEVGLPQWEFVFAGPPSGRSGRGVGSTVVVL